jgi:hypothetical protein
MKVLPVAVGSSTVTSAGILALRPSAAVMASLIQLSSLLMYGWIKWSLQRQSQHNTLALMERAKDCQVSVVVDETGRIEITPAGASALTTSPASTDHPPQWRQWVRWVRWPRGH